MSRKTEAVSSACRTPVEASVSFCVALIAASVLSACGAWALSLGSQGSAASSLIVSRSVQPIAIFGKDDRTPLPSSRQDVGRGIGLLVEPNSKTVCSAFCVDDRIVATAGHCIFRTEGETAPEFSRFKFRLPGTDPQISSRVAGGDASGHQFVAAPSKPLSVAPPIDAANDWALVVLADPVCRGRSLSVARYSADQVLRLSERGRVFQISYHRDYGKWDLAYGARCPVRRSFGGSDWRTIQNDFAKPDQVLLHTCDTGGASSGSPLLADTVYGTQVVGINVGTYVQSRVLKRDEEVIHRYRADRLANTGVSSLAFLSRLEALKRAEIIADRAGILRLQEHLSQLGYYREQLDGYFGPKLRAAIESFERSERREPTGLATRSLLNRLRALLSEQGFGGTADATIRTDKIGSHEATFGVGEIEDLR